MLVLCLALLAAPQGLTGGNTLKAASFEAKVLEALNKGRGIDPKKPLFTMDEKLRVFARKYAQLAATDAKQAAGLEPELKNDKLAPRGYRYQFVGGSEASAIASQVRIDFDMPAKAGIGAYAVSAKDYQVLVVLAIDVDPMEGKPGLTPAQTDPVMNEATPRINSTCYNAALQRNPNLKGELVVQLVIAEGGAVTSSKVLQGLGDAEFDNCALALVSKLRFPEPYKGKPVTLNHPMSFMPPQGDKTVGYLSRAQIDATFSTASEDLRTCYDNVRKASPKLSGTVAFTLDVNGGGGVDAVNVSSNSTGSSELAGCLVKRLYQLHFPPPRYSAPLQVVYPLTFVPDK